MNSKFWNVTGVIVQVLLAVVLLWAGYTKLFTPQAKLSAMWPWTAGNPTLVMVAGVFDILGGVGVVLPSLLKVKPQWTLYAAIGIILLMFSAAIFHIARGEVSDIGINVFVIILAGVVSWRYFIN
ncbi:DoxX family protein [Sphingobacterium thalpophilum]|uniref:DoxX family protein n=1 Tax=Sphingobacterium thalpophilum TaxID=259 RepID=UPI0024A70882|nr:DoxX family protein [Sphingobacterium thalpophilum]